MCSIYLNPTQFGNTEDLAKYPRTLEQDISMLEKEKCDIVFRPRNAVKLEADRIDFAPMEELTDKRHAVVRIAAKVGPVRLIDNLVVQF